MTRRPPDAGTDNEYTIVGDLKVVVLANSGSDFHHRESHVLIKGRHGSIMVTPHQANALGSVLSAAAALADRLEQED